MGKIDYSQLFILIARLVLASVFALAALPKIKDPVAFASSVEGYRVLGPALSNWVALLLPWLELIIGIGILMPWIRRSSGIIIAALLVVFVSLHASAWMRGLEIDCGCFGSEASDKTTNYLRLIIRNFLLLGTCFFVICKDWKRNKRTR